MNYGAGGVQKNSIEDFWKKVDVQGEHDCWPWKEAVFSNGYGRFKQNYKSVRAHRVALENAKGPAPEDKPLALHECLLRKCCNPKHLYWGSHEDNMKDRRMNYKPSWNRKSDAVLGVARKELTIAEWEASWGHGS